MTCLLQLHNRVSWTDPTVCSLLVLLEFFASFLSSVSVKAFPIVRQSVLNPGVYGSANSVISTIGGRYSRCLAKTGHSALCLAGWLLRPWPTDNITLAR